MGVVVVVLMVKFLNLHPKLNIKYVVEGKKMCNAKVLIHTNCLKLDGAKKCNDKIVNGMKKEVSCAKVSCDKCLMAVWDNGEDGQIVTWPWSESVQGGWISELKKHPKRNMRHLFVQEKIQMNNLKCLSTFTSNFAKIHTAHESQS